MKRRADADGGAVDDGTKLSRSRFRLSDDFFDRPCQEVAVGLLGQTLVRQQEDGSQLRCRIVETECYLGVVDKACHTFGGRRTEKNAPMYMKPGTSYVYFTYGMYHCFNISSKEEGSAVLLRAAEPLEGEQTMQQHRRAHLKTPRDKAWKQHELCNGPSKLCMSLAIERFTCNAKDLTQWTGLWLEEAERPAEAVVTSTRVGIDSVEKEWRLKPLRFYLLGSKSVSRRDKEQEGKIT
ncbi:DNA-3-methyladenine glycosylase-like [Neocloeon triangulifer]|uniref:DNA-3-methyladenine glycosylase-like n=1 Tax=Neocloeon triangulifer TaxID=2078957 RepID=UPI00286F9CBE|nr:DNA-3-methyladenine glycosylase-like [Neocloeon triangulifer]